MTYYKVVADNIVIGVGTTKDLREVQRKHNILIMSDEDHAQYIQLEEQLYRDDWFAPVLPNSSYSYTPASITAIPEENYNALKEELDAGGAPAVEENIEPEIIAASAPDDDIEEPKTRLQYLEEQVVMLTECLLEMSEMIYGGE